MTAESVALTALVDEHGYSLLLLASVVEGPVATIMAAALAQEGHLILGWVLLIAVLGDLLGDLLVHLAGRGLGKAMPTGLRQRLRLDHHIVGPLVDHFRQQGAWMLVAAKWTHFAGLPTIFASGVARMPIFPFLLVSLAAALPKVAFLCGLGWYFGLALAGMQLPVWLVVLGIGLSCLALFLLLCKRRSPWA